MNHKTRSAIASLVLGLGIGIFIKLFVLDIVHISGSSMEPTFKEGDDGLVKPFGSVTLCRWNAPQAGDVILFMHEGRLVIKRCVATAAEPLDYSCDTGYTLAVNGQQIPLSEAQYKNMALTGQVPDGMIFAVGDNPDASIDSRDYGFIPLSNILARAVGAQKGRR
mgnify:CR=1 FL=1